MKKLITSAILTMSLSFAVAADELTLMGKSVDAVPSNAVLSAPTPIGVTGAINDVSYTSTEQRTLGDALYEVTLTLDYTDVGNPIARCRSLVDTLAEQYAEKGEALPSTSALVYLFRGDYNATLRMEDGCQLSQTIGLTLTSPTPLDASLGYTETNLARMVMDGNTLTPVEPIEEAAPEDGGKDGGDNPVTPIIPEPPVKDAEEISPINPFAVIKGSRGDDR